VLLSLKRAMSTASLKEIEAKRKAAEKAAQGKERKEGGNHKLVCPSCTKPNSLTVTHCTGCGFELSKWDEQEISGKELYRFWTSCVTGYICSTVKLSLSSLALSFPHLVYVTEWCRERFLGSRTRKGYWL
jgi:hypothetical protein